jgi:hypothetical protein
MAVRKVVVKTKPKRRYAEGGKVEEKPVTRPAAPRTFLERMGVTGGALPDAFRRRQERMDAVERGAPDPGQVPKVEEKARGGRIRK